MGVAGKHSVIVMIDAHTHRMYPVTGASDAGPVNMEAGWCPWSVIARMW